LFSSGIGDESFTVSIPTSEAKPAGRYQLFNRIERKERKTGWIDGLFFDERCAKGIRSRQRPLPLYVLCVLCV
jgi:hypothetical protein